jgi:hypothetical protein
MEETGSFNLPVPVALLALGRLVYAATIGFFSLAMPTVGNVISRSRGRQRIVNRVAARLLNPVESNGCKCPLPDGLLADSEKGFYIVGSSQKF